MDGIFAIASYIPTTERLHVNIVRFVQMDWYLREESNDLLVPNDQMELEDLSMEDLSPSTDNWHQLGATRSELMGSPYEYFARSNKFGMEEFNFSTQNLSNKEAPGGKIEESRNSDTYWVPSSGCCSARTPESSISGRPDLQLHNSMERTDDIFLNSFLEEDSDNTGDSLQSRQMFPDSIYKSILFEDFLTDMLIDPQSPMDFSKMECSAFLNASSIALFSHDISEGWGTAEECLPSCLVPEDCKRSDNSPMEPDVTDLLSSEIEHAAVADADELNSVEAIALLELEKVTIQLSEKTRICFRDALYRLAKSSRQQCTISEESSANFLDKPTFTGVAEENPRTSGLSNVESKTNVIDRTVANIMFNKLYCNHSEVTDSQSLPQSKEDSSASASYYSSDQQ